MRKIDEDVFLDKNRLFVSMRHNPQSDGCGPRFDHQYVRRDARPVGKGYRAENGELASAVLADILPGPEVGYADHSEQAGTPAAG